MIELLFGIGQIVLAVLTIICAFEYMRLQSNYRIIEHENKQLKHELRKRLMLDMLESQDDKDDKDEK